MRTVSTRAPATAATASSAAGAAVEQDRVVGDAGLQVPRRRGAGRRERGGEDEDEQRERPMHGHINAHKAPESRHLPPPAAPLGRQALGRQRVGLRVTALAAFGSSPL